MKFSGILILTLMMTSMEGLSQKVYLGWSVRPIASLNTLELNEDFLLSDYNWRVYKVDKKRQTNPSGSFGFGPTILLDLFRVNLTVGAHLSYRAYDFEANRIVGQNMVELESSTLGETLIEIPMLIGVTLFSGKPVKFYMEGGINYNIILDQTESEPLLSGGDIFINYLMDGQNYMDLVGGAGIRYKNMYFTLRAYVRNSALNNQRTKSRFWTFSYLITMKSTKYSKHFINL